ncbi:MAG: mechanosensitive ion channel family protein [Bacteroidota bacterium]
MQEQDSTQVSIDGPMTLLDPTFWEERMGNVVAGASEFLPKIALALLGLFLGFKLIARVVRFLDGGFRKSGMGEDIRPFLVSLISIGLKVILIFIIAGTVGIETTSIVALLGAAAFAVGIALQGSLENFAAGILVLLYKPYKVGDLIEVHEQMGYVQQIQIFNTIILTLDNKTVIIPNSMANSDVITNYSEKGYLRVDLSVSMPYEEDFDKVKEIIMAAIRDTPKVLENPAPEVGIHEFDSHSVTLAVWPYAQTDDYWEVYFSVNQSIKKAMGKAGIKVAYSEGIELGKIGL